MKKILFFGSLITGTAIAIGLGGLVLLNIAASYAIEHSFSEESRRATVNSLAMIGLAVLGLFFGVRLIKRGGTTSIASSITSIVLRFPPKSGQENKRKSSTLKREEQK